MREESKEEGKREGISIGRTEGISIGRTEGITIGRSEGISLGKQVFRLWLAGKPEEEIAKACGISVEEVREILL